MNPADILDALRELTARERVDFLPLAPDPRPLSAYPPVAKYLLDLKNGSKPESAAEDLFTALWKDLFNVQPTRQVGVAEGFVDFMVPERMGDPLPLELKPLFQRDKRDSLWRKDANPAHHVPQVKKYLTDHEYLILTDLRNAWFYCARDFFFEGKPFARLPFVEFLSRSLETRSVLDTLRRAEDMADKPELEQQFFEDLKIWYNEFDKVKWKELEQSAESIILLINKLIFARTIEDFGLVQYRFVQDEYARVKKLWEPKGPHRVVPKFLQAFEEFFDEYYDTEIFSARVWDRLDQNPDNLRRFSEKLNFVLGVHTWDQTFSRGIVHYNYRRIDEDIFGKSYEMFLASNRKDEGIYYTPAGITAPMADSLVNSLTGPLVDEICDAVGSQKCDYQRAEKLLAQLAEIRVADTACGSGGFFLRSFSFSRGIRNEDLCSRRLCNRPIQSAYPVFPKRRHRWTPDYHCLQFQIPSSNSAPTLRHSYPINEKLRRLLHFAERPGCDIDLPFPSHDEREPEVEPPSTQYPKTNIWKEAVKLSPADNNYRLLKMDVVKILPNLELNFHCADSLVDVEIGKQVEWLAEYHRAELKKLSELRTRYIANPMRHEALDEALALRKRVHADFVEHFQGENLPCEPGGLALHFWPCWFNADGTAKGRAGSPLPAETSTGKERRARSDAPYQPAGFDGIIGNPPWEGFKPIRKEFTANFYRGKPQFSKMGMDGPTFEKWFADELESNKEFAARWRDHEDYYERHKAYFGRAYQKQGTGDWNLFKLFIERDLSLVRHGGQFSLLVPSSIQTDEGCADLRRWFITENRLDELTSFENRGYKVLEDGEEKTKQIFPDVDGRFKFSFFKVVKGAVTPKDHAFDARFYLHDPKDHSSAPIRYAVEMIRRFSPHNESFMEFRSPTDYALAAKIRGGHRLLGELGYTFRRELHMTGDNRFFQKLGDKKPAKEQLRLYEGKMIHQFDADYSPPTFVVDEVEVREELLRKEIFRLSQFVRDEKLEKLEGKIVPNARDELDDLLRQVFEKRKFKLQYEFDRFAYREVASSTNERTIISTIIPKQVCAAHTLMYLNPYCYEVDGKEKLQQREVASHSLRELVCLTNSLVLNFLIRSKVTTHVSIFQFEELPIPQLTGGQRTKLAEFAEALLKDPRDVKERAALEVFIAQQLYGLSREDWQHLTGTFTFGGGETKVELDEIIRRSPSGKPTFQPQHQP